MELFNANEVPLSGDPRVKDIQERLLRGEDITFGERILIGRDHPVKEIGGYELKPDHAYRAISADTYKIYKEQGFINGIGPNDEYEEEVIDGKVYNNNKGVNWYLGGAVLKYGEIIIECPADKEYFLLPQDNGNRMSYDPSVKFIKSSGTKKSVPMSMITNVFNVKEIMERLNKENVEAFEGVRKETLESVLANSKENIEGVSR